MSQRSVPIVSVVMPAYNAEKYIGEAIDSILGQTFTDFEFIIVNDGSTDKTKEIIESYDDPRLVYLENEKNSGIVKTLNKGLDAAQGKYIARMDADDISMPERFAEQVRYLDRHPDIGIVGSWLRIIDGDGVYKYDFKFKTRPDDCYANMLYGTPVAHPAVMLRAEILRNNNLNYDDNFRGIEDYFLWWQCRKYTKITNIAQPLINYRKHNSQITNNQISEDFLEKQEKFMKLRLKDLGVDYNESEFDVLIRYTRQRNSFNDTQLYVFIDFLKKILVASSIEQPAFKSAVKQFIAEMITSVIDKSHQHLISKTRIGYLKVAFRKGLIPFWWLLKQWLIRIKSIV